MKNNFLEVALIGKTVGLKGGLKLHDRSDFPKQFKTGAKFYLNNGDSLSIASFVKNNSVITFVGYEDIKLASKLVNKTLYQSKDETRKTCKLAKNEFFYFDILGLEIYESDLLLGVVEDILEVGSDYLFEVKTDKKLSDKELSSNFFVPYNDKYVKEISLKESKIIAENALSILENS